MARLKDVAARAGVSVGTASKVLSSARAAQPFSPECVLRVRTAARELGYTPSYLARSLQTGRSYGLGLALGGLGRSAWEGFWSQMIGGVMGQAHALGYHFVTVGSTVGATAVAQGLSFLRERRIDALVVPAFACGGRVPEELIDTGAPVVLTSFSAETPLPSVDLEEASGIAAAVEHLRGLGHRRLLWVGERDNPHPSCETRRGAFWQSVRDAGLDGRELLMPHTPGAHPRGMHEHIAASRMAVLEHCRDGLDATGIVCYEEGIAFGAYAALAEMGLRVPQDVSVIGFDDIYADVAWPPMTVVSHMLEQIGRTAAELAIRMADGGVLEEEPRRTLVPAELVVRSSTGPAPTRDNGR